MGNKFLHRLALSSILTLSCASFAFARADLFSDLSYEQAKLKAKEDHKLLLIDFTAKWCPPCQMMEKTTWPDESLQAWIKENTVAIQVDVDVDPKTSEILQVPSMPTILVFSPDNINKELARLKGYGEPDELLRWLKLIKDGKAGEGVEQKKSAINQNEIWQHISGARELLNSQKFAEALDDYIWLWTQLPKADETFKDIRLKMLPHEMKQLAAAYPPAKVKWIELRDAADKADNREDWIIFNAILDNTAYTLSWFDSAKIDPKKLAFIKNNSALFEPVLFANCRWNDATQYLYPDPLAKIGEYHKIAEKMKKPRPDTEVSKDFDPLPSMILLVYGAYIGANKEAEAKKIADECIRLDDTPAMHTNLEAMAKSMRAARASQSKTGK